MMNWKATWTFDRPNQTYHPGETANVTCTFNNVAGKPLHLRRLGIHLGWMSENEWVFVNANTVVQPGIPGLLGQTYTLPVKIPLDVEIGYHDFAIGADLREWEGNNWSGYGGVQWVKPLEAANDQIAIQYLSPRGFQVFVSHSEKDRALADFVSDYIKRCGQMPYLAESTDNPEVGRKLWEEKIKSAMSKSNIVLVLWTGNSISSIAVQKEVEMANQMNKLILPVVDEGTPFPTQFLGRVYVKFRVKNRLDAVKIILQSLLNYEAEQRKGQEAVGAIAEILALLIIGGTASGKRKSSKHDQVAIIGEPGRHVGVYCITADQHEATDWQLS